MGRNFKKKIKNRKIDIMEEEEEEEEEEERKKRNR